MKILHYLANQLKGTPIFENGHRKIDTNKKSGAFFNDFDFQPDELLSSTHNDTVNLSAVTIILMKVAHKTFQSKTI